MDSQLSINNVIVRQAINPTHPNPKAMGMWWEIRPQSRDRYERTWGERLADSNVDRKACCCNKLQVGRQKARLLKHCDIKPLLKLKI